MRLLIAAYSSLLPDFSKKKMVADVAIRAAGD